MLFVVETKHVREVINSHIKRVENKTSHGETDEEIILDLKNILAEICAHEMILPEISKK